ncbi:hypothetical protein GCM10012284_19640 [Mangrovihabitans endophyticus]|uniref:Integral membrane protein n=1 Tax=Mangrovihabitans endophyticus TaxID=1751298 RepID=A0A8J3BWP6_9ACTN|nr:hypothetical protein GCM10012284_19640 [Mangrovihabitans endophyticus]
MLTGWLTMSLGVFAVVLGTLWTLQGLGEIGGSVMSGVTAWAIAGPVVGVAGMVLVVVGARLRARAKR